MGNRVNLHSCGILLAVLVAGCGVNPVNGLDAPDQLTLYSLDGNHRWVEQSGESQEEKPKEPDKVVAELFHEFPVLGKVAIDDAAKRAEIMNAFKQGIDRSDGTMNKCFWPRHGIRATKDKKTADFVICFQCLQFETHNGSTNSTKPISRDPQQIFNKSLEAAGVPLAPASDSDESN